MPKHLLSHGFEWLKFGVHAPNLHRDEHADDHLWMVRVVRVFHCCLPITSNADTPIQQQRQQQQREQRYTSVAHRDMQHQLQLPRNAHEHGHFSGQPLVTAASKRRSPPSERRKKPGMVPSNSTTTTTTTTNTSDAQSHLSSSSSSSTSSFHSRPRSRSMCHNQRPRSKSLRQSDATMTPTKYFPWRCSSVHKRPRGATPRHGEKHRHGVKRAAKPMVRCPGYELTRATGAALQDEGDGVCITLFLTGVRRHDIDVRAHGRHVEVHAIQYCVENDDGDDDEDRLDMEEEDVMRSVLFKIRFRLDPMFDVLRARVVSFDERRDVLTIVVPLVPDVEQQLNANSTNTTSDTDTLNRNDKVVNEETEPEESSGDLITPTKVRGCDQQPHVRHGHAPFEEQRRMLFVHDEYEDEDILDDDVEDDELDKQRIIGRGGGGGDALPMMIFT